MSAQLDISELQVRYGSARVLDDLHLHVPEGGLVAVVGPSGAGKTTLLRALMGLAPVSGGSIQLDCTDLRSRPPHRRDLGVVFQQPRLLPHLDALDNVALPLRSIRMNRRGRRAAAQRMLERVDLADRAQHRPSQLSGGEAQRVALARALVREPSVLLLDEPLSAVDPPLRAQLQRLILDVVEELGMTTLLVTHDRDEAARLGTSTAVLLDGRIEQHAAPATLAIRPATRGVASFMGGGSIFEPRSVLHEAIGRDASASCWLPSVAVRVRTPEAAAARAPAGSRQITISGQVRHTRFTALGWHVEVDVDGVLVPVVIADAQAPAAGAKVELDVDVALIGSLPHA